MAAGRLELTSVCICKLCSKFLLGLLCTMWGLCTIQSTLGDDGKQMRSALAQRLHTSCPRCWWVYIESGCTEPSSMPRMAPESCVDSPEDKKGVMCLTHSLLWQWYSEEMWFKVSWDRSWLTCFLSWSAPPPLQPMTHELWPTITKYDVGPKEYVLLYIIGNCDCPA